MPGQVTGKGKLPTVYCSLFMFTQTKRPGFDSTGTAFAHRSAIDVGCSCYAPPGLKSKWHLQQDCWPLRGGRIPLGGARNETEGQGRGFRVSRFGFLVSGSFKRDEGRDRGTRKAVEGLSSLPTLKLRQAGEFRVSSSAFNLDLRTLYGLSSIRYSLFAIRYSLFAIRYSLLLFAIRYSLFAIHYSLFTIHYSLFTNPKILHHRLLQQNILFA